ncbi:MAG TPA: FAD/NAD(P)-binding protein [Victivallales bacterium]|nr:FAD/NAD(P)-binding protein [Victivallales bacterium]
MKNPYLPVPVILKNISIENDTRDLKTFDFSFTRPEDAKDFEFSPGQFAMIYINGIGEAPFGIASSPMKKNIIQFTVKRYPNGILTRALHDLQVGSEIGLRGPFGNAYPIDKFESKNIFVVGGGFALTTLRSLANYILHDENRNRFGKLTMFVAARNPSEFLYKKDLIEWNNSNNVEVIQAIDTPSENWHGEVGYAADVLKSLSISEENTIAVICGPPIMIKTCLPVLFDRGFTADRIITSLEMKMKCGIGKCGRCNIGSKYICKDGPVFSYKELQQLSKEY